MPQVHDLVAPKLGANRLRHAEGINVEDSASDAELRDVIHHRHALESDRLEMVRQLAQPVRFTFAQLDAERLQRARHSRFLGESTRRREQHTKLPARQSLECLDALARHLHMRLRFAEPFARRIECEPASSSSSVREVGEPPLGFGHTLGRDHDEPRRQATDHRRDGAPRRPSREARPR